MSKIIIIGHADIAYATRDAIIASSKSNIVEVQVIDQNDFETDLVEITKKFEGNFKIKNFSIQSLHIEPKVKKQEKGYKHPYKFHK